MYRCPIARSGWEIVVIFVVGAIFLLAPFPIIWRPWVSPDYAAKALVQDDGKGLAFWIPSAARYWGYRVVEPISRYTNDFAEVNRDPLIRTLIDIFSESDAPQLTALTLKLLASRNVNAQLLGCYTGENSSAPNLTIGRCQMKIGDVLSAVPNIDNQTEIMTALRIVSRSNMSGMTEPISNLMMNQKAPFGVRVEACIAALRIPERDFMRPVVDAMDKSARQRCSEIHSDL